MATDPHRDPVMADAAAHLSEDGCHHRFPTESLERASERAKADPAADLRKQLTEAVASHAIAVERWARTSADMSIAEDDMNACRSRVDELIKAVGA
jgi:hypothetical protein